MVSGHQGLDSVPRLFVHFFLKVFGNGDLVCLILRPFFAGIQLAACPEPWDIGVPFSSTQDVGGEQGSL